MLSQIGLDGFLLSFCRGHLILETVPLEGQRLDSPDQTISIPACFPLAFPCTDQPMLGDR